jgi:hypothetical protein
MWACEYQMNKKFKNDLINMPSLVYWNDWVYNDEDGWNLNWCGETLFWGIF